jgi:hypothetical protein
MLQSVKNVSLPVNCSIINKFLNHQRQHRVILSPATFSGLIVRAAAIAHLAIARDLGAQPSVSGGHAFGWADRYKSSSNRNERS